MNTLGDEIVLAPQFMVELPKNKNVILTSFARANNALYKVTTIRDRIFIKMSGNKETWWSPQLHLEIDKIDESRSILFGWFAPRSVLWNFLLVLQIAISFAFIASVIWTYLNRAGGIDYTLPLVLAILMIPCWVILYFIRRSGKSRGRLFIYGFYEFLNNRMLLS